MGIIDCQGFVAFSCDRMGLPQPAYAFEGPIFEIRAINQGPLSFGRSP